MKSGGGQRVIVVEHRLEVDLVIGHEIVVVKEVKRRDVSVSLLFRGKTRNQELAARVESGFPLTFLRQL